MTATNHTGYEVQIHVDRRIGWVMETNGYDSMEEAQSEIACTPDDDFERRAYESLEGYLCKTPPL